MKETVYNNLEAKLAEVIEEKRRKKEEEERKKREDEERKRKLEDQKRKREEEYQRQKEIDEQTRLFTRQNSEQLAQELTQLSESSSTAPNKTAHGQSVSLFL